MPERKRHIPKWAERERAADLAWIMENLSDLWPAAWTGYAAHGRGALAVDTTVQPVPDKGHPVFYLVQQQIDEYGGPDEIRMVVEYDPTWEMVTILLKERERISSYRIGIPSLRPK